MNDAEEIKQLLTEIRDMQREHLTEYRRMAERSVALQERAVARQEQIGRIYKIAMFVVAALVLGLLALLANLMGQF